jgi:hypothetical protein
MGQRPASIDRTLVGFRIFRERRGELHSLTPAAGGRERWPAGGIVNAACEQPARGQVPHLAPANGCRCGVYAVDSMATLRRTLSHFWFWRLRAAGNTVTAAVQVWGSPGRPVIVGELRGAPGYQYRAPHMRVLALADSPAARRVARRHGMPVLPAAGLEPYAREHGTQMRPGRTERKAVAATARPVAARARFGGSLIAAVGKWARPRAPRAWTIGLAVLLTLVASARLVLFVGWTALLVTASVLRWLVPRLLYVAACVLLDPVGAVVRLVAAAALLVTAWVAVAALVRWVIHL